MDTSGNIRSQRLPALSIVFGLVHVRIAVVHLMEIDRDVGGSGIVAGRLDVTNRAPRWQIGDVRRDVGPVCAAIPRDVDQTVIGAGPNDSLL